MFYDEKGDGWSPATLSLWSDMEALFAFACSGLHAEAFKRAREWFQRPFWPPPRLWWHEGGAVPTWAEGVARQARLFERGPTRFAFDFKLPFDAAGAPAALGRADPQLVRREHGLIGAGVALTCPVFGGDARRLDDTRVNGVGWRQANGWFCKAEDHDGRAPSP